MAQPRRLGLLLLLLAAASPGLLRAQEKDDWHDPEELAAHAREHHTHVFGPHPRDDVRNDSSFDASDTLDPVWHVPGDPARGYRNILDAASPEERPREFGPMIQGGLGVTSDRDSFHFYMAGVQGGKVLGRVLGPGLLRGDLEFGVQILPYWQSDTPRFVRIRCPAGDATCAHPSGPYLVGGTFRGSSVTPIILRWNFVRHGRLVPWAQAAGGLIWTNHKYPAYGDTTRSFHTNGPNGETSVFNFSPQGGIGVHYFLRPDRSLDFSANGVHISSASLGDRNPGVNASVQFSLGYTWWK